MNSYRVQTETALGQRQDDWLPFATDDDAISYFLPLARGRLVEISCNGKMIARIDERLLIAVAS
jgi:hypothetical protein